jgi:hypothetical protein
MEVDVNSLGLLFQLFHLLSTRRGPCNRCGGKSSI